MYSLIYNITTYERPAMAVHLVRQILEQAAPDTFIDVIDDHSAQDISSLAKLFENYRGDPKMRLTVNARRLGIHVNQVTRLNDPIYDDQEFVYLSDDDVVLGSRFATELSDLIELMRADENIFASTLFNVDPPWHQVVGDYNDRYVEKGSFGGISMLIRAGDFHSAMDHYLTSQYEGWNGWDWAVVNYAKRIGRRLIATRSSHLQHLGADGVNSTAEYFDYARNFVE